MGSSIKPKLGICIDCGPGSIPKYLTAKRCKNHYWEHRAKVNKDKAINKARRNEKKELGIYFASQILLIPDNCENCGNRIYIPHGMTKRAAVCHIVPKEFFKTVETHPQNRWFGCIECHTDYDRKGLNKGGVDYQSLMNVAPLVVERFLEFMHLLNKEEVRRLPVWLKKIYYINIFDGK